MHQPSSQQGLLEDPFSSFQEFDTKFSSYVFDTQSFLTHEDHDLLHLPCSSSSFSNSPSLLELISNSIQPTFQYPNNYTDESIYSCDPCLDSFIPINGSVSSSFYDQQMFPLMVEVEEEDEEEDINDGDHEDHKNDVVSQNLPTVFSIGSDGEKKSKSKKAEGQPSKNLMAERRRRKRLNDRLSMLRSIVPKISKMDRTSILGDTIDYMKELMKKIQDLKEQDNEAQYVDHLKMVGNFKDFNMNESQVIRNPPKFQVERGDTDTRIKICCSAKPGLLLSNVNTFDALGLDIQECVISCFNDFSLQACCSEAQDHRSMISCEDLKQVLFKNAGYGGRC
uniref:transcription factor bHLH93-like n=1 Tax=Erigeron canadensis TaxID=72917 RepID=UPI001CB89A03|nr:transcription factor bHLH93-like [Erigeron canadensis]